MPGLDGLAHLIRPAAGEPEGALVLMHGRGTSEQDLAGLLEVLDPARRFVGACPRGPLELSPMGFHWYAVPRVGHPDPDTFLASDGVAIVHGTEDPVIPVEFGRAARDLAGDGSAEVLYREGPVGHFIDPHIVPELTTWVQARRASAPLS